MSHKLQFVHTHIEQKCVQVTSLYENKESVSVASMVAIVF